MWNTFIDIDECKLKISNCDENADCMNTEGSHECQCKAGYQGNGIICKGYFNALTIHELVNELVLKLIDFRYWWMCHWIP